MLSEKIKTLLTFISQCDILHISKCDISHRNIAEVGLWISISKKFTSR